MLTLLAQVDCVGYRPGPWPLLWFGWWIVVAVVVALWWRRGGRRWRGFRSPESVLGERYARGEITDDEYRARLAVLREHAR